MRRQSENRVFRNMALAVAMACLAILPSPANAAGAGGYSAPASELVLLPQFCWGQYNAQYSGGQYFPSECGPFMNHYCPALLDYNRAFREISREKRAHIMRTVLENMEYSIKGMKEFPACSIRQHVEKTYKRVRADMGLPPLPRTQPPPTSASGAAEEKKPVAETGPTESKQEPVSKPAEQAEGLSAKAVKSAREPQASEPVIPSQDASSPKPAVIGTPRNPWCRFCAEDDSSPPNPSPSTPATAPTTAP